jgi:hypothetical protein
LLIAWTAAAAFAAECPRTISTAELDRLLADARRSLERLDTRQFVETTDAVDLALPCLGEPITRHLAAEIHRTKGIRAVSERDPDAERIFAAARSIEPAYKFPSTLIPDGNPVRIEYSRFDLATGTVERLPDPAGGSLMLDGTSNLWRPIAWPTVAQYLAADGAVSWTAYVTPGTPMPPYPVVGPAPADVSDVNPLLVTSEVAEPIREKRSPRVPLAVAAGTSAALTAVSWALAADAANKFEDPTTPDAELDALQSRANTLTIVGGFTGVATVGFGIGFVAVR